MHAGRRLRDSTFLSYQSNVQQAAHCEARARASIVRLIHDRMLRGARVGRRGLGGVSVMRAARGWVALVARAAVAAARFRVVSPVRPQREVGTRDRGARGRVRCSRSLPIGPVARGEGVGRGCGRASAAVTLRGSWGPRFLGRRFGSRGFRHPPDAISCLNSNFFKPQKLIQGPPPTLEEEVLPFRHS